MKAKFFKKLAGEKKAGEASFTLLETIIALGLMVTVILEVGSLQGKSIGFSDYNRKLTQGTWLAQALMAQVERAVTYYDFKELKLELKEQTFSESLCPRDPPLDCPYTYDITIAPFPLPVVGLVTKNLAANMGQASEGQDLAAMIESQVKNFLGDELLKLAHVEVFWPEGATRNSVELSYLLTNQKQLDEQIYLQNPIETTASADGPPPEEGSSGIDPQKRPAAEPRGKKEPPAGDWNELGNGEPRGRPSP